MSELNLINLAEVESKEVKWLWEPYLPAGKITILRGNPGEGKTMLALSIIAALTTGAPLFGEEEQREPVCCIYQSAEDGLADTIKPRLEAAGADCSKVRVIDESGASLSFADERIEQAIVQTNAKLLVLDPLQAYLTGVDMHRANEVRPAFHTLMEIAERTGCAILLIEHLNKMRGLKAIQRGLGSVDITGAARSVLLLSKPKADESEVYLAPVKSNLAEMGQTLVFVAENGRLYYEGTSALTADELVDQNEVSDVRPTKVKEAAQMLLDYFGRREAIPSTEVEAFFNSKGISTRTLKRAKANLGIKSELRGNAWYYISPPYL